MMNVITKLEAHFGVPFPPGYRNWSEKKYTDHREGMNRYLWVHEAEWIPPEDIVDVSPYDAIFMPGGLAPMVDMPEHPRRKKVIQETYVRQAVVGAVCHGPVSLLNVRLRDGSYLVAGKNISSFTNAEEENYAKADVPFELESALVKQGALFHQAAPWQAFSIADGRLVTGQNPASAKGAAEKMIALLEAP